MILVRDNQTAINLQKSSKDQIRDIFLASNWTWIILQIDFQFLRKSQSYIVQLRDIPSATLKSHCRAQLAGPNSDRKVDFWSSFLGDSCDCG